MNPRPTQSAPTPLRPGGRPLWAPAASVPDQGPVQQALGGLAASGPPAELASVPPTTGQLRELYLDAQLSTYQIAELVGVSHTTIWTWLKAAGIPRRPRNWAASHQRPRRTRPPTRPRTRDIDASRLRQLYLDDRQSINQLAKTLDIPPSTVYGHLVRAGIPRRQPGGTGSKNPGREVLWALHRQQGLSLAAIGRRYGVCDRAVAKWLVAVGIPLPGRGRRPSAPPAAPAPPSPPTAPLSTPPGGRR